MLALCTLLIAAASDLSPLEAKLKSAVPGCEMRISFAASGTLARQIRAGADYDVFLAASLTFIDTAWVDSVTRFAQGRLGVYSSRGLRWKDLGTAGQIAIANPDTAPYGRAARQVLERQGFWPKVQSRMVYGENVRQAFQFAATGNADIALVSWSLVHDRGGELLPETWHDPIIQAAGIPKRVRNRTAAERFLRWLRSTEGREVLKAGGFTPL